MRKISEEKLPKHIEPLQMTDKGARLEGSLSFQEMARFSELLLEKSGTAIITLQFSKDLQGFRNINGTISARIVLTCQRCLNPVTYNLEVTVKLSPIVNEAGAKSLPEEYDPLLVNEESMLLSDIIEEELLLSMPFIARHEVGACTPHSPEYLH